MSAGGALALHGVFVPSFLFALFAFLQSKIISLSSDSLLAA
jgi:hypothetical protein